MTAVQNEADVVGFDKVSSISLSCPTRHTPKSNSSLDSTRDGTARVA